MLIQIDKYLPNDGDKRIKEDIIAGLSGTSKKISCVFFYDKVGSKLFEEITKLPEYYLTRTEIPLIEKAASQLSSSLKNVDIVELGSGDCTKISILLDAVPKENRESICYVPFDVSMSAVENSSTILLNKFPGIKIKGIVADFMTQLDIISNESKKVFCFLGSTIGNLSIEQAQEFLINISTIMNTGDLLLLGFDMVKNKTILEKAYNDSQNITDKFNKNILNVINNHINSDFKTENFEHIALYNEKLSRIEMHLKTTCDFEVFIPDLQSYISMKKGETIHTENSYKFTEENIINMAKGADLKIQHIYTDEDKWFSLVQLIK